MPVLPFVFIQLLPYFIHSLKAHLIYQVETFRCPLVVLVLMVCPEHQLWYCNIQIQCSRASITAKPFKKLLAYDVCDTGQLVRGFLKGMQ